MCFIGIQKELHCIFFNGCSNSLERIEGEKDTKKNAGRTGQKLDICGPLCNLAAGSKDISHIRVFQALFQVCLLVFSLLKQ